MTTHKILSNKLITKLGLSFFFIVLLMGLIYVITTLFFSKKFYEETSQKLNANIANHLIEEKFKDAAPFLENGKVNKPLFNDIMHDMMAVNRAIEVYLLSEKGEVLYSVVLDHSSTSTPLKTINLKPIQSYIKNKGSLYILGDDPRNSENKKIFSAAHFNKNGQSGYIYIVLGGKVLETINQSLLSSYFMKLGLGTTLLTMLFAALIGLLCIWFLTKNLRSIIYQVNRFREGDLESRIANAETSDLSTLALTYNQMADTISQNIEEIKSVDVLRRELIANVSHDLRTPLAIMQGYIETLQIKEDQLDAHEKKQYVLIIEKSIKQLTKMVSQLFEYSKLEAKQMKPHKEPFAITDLIYDIKGKYQVLAKEKNIKLEVEIMGQTPLVFADISLVERVIQNLMDNALNFTPQNGDIGLIITHNKEQVFIKVKDSGPGIKKEEQAFIFDRFRQAETTQKTKGNGLGLAIVKKIIDLHETNIKVISNSNTGSTFEFYLPSYNI